ncbi:hypothetical protein GF325_08140 [Candidatus Bathyarchaeota archaeon]|nr:hypothetical protein [Candidatus Bathyarchaeota archaeon]
MTGICIQYLYRKKLRKRNKDAKIFFGSFLIASIWIYQFLVYFDVLTIFSWFSWIPEQDGATYLWNSWQFWQFFGSSPRIIPSLGMGYPAFYIALGYPLWFNLGIKVGKLLYGNKVHERGMSWFFEPAKDVDEPGLA